MIDQAEDPIVSNRNRYAQRGGRPVLERAQRGMVNLGNASESDAAGVFVEAAIDVSECVGCGRTWRRCFHETGGTCCIYCDDDDHNELHRLGELGEAEPR